MLCVVLVFMSGIAQAGIPLLVTSTNDSGLGSLRQAILLANAAPGLDTIQFNIAGAPPFTIRLQNKLPQISDPVVIDGTSQPGFVNAPVIELDGTSAGGGSGLEIISGNCIVRGLAIHSFNQDGIKLSNVGSNVIDGCFIGTDATGMNALGNGQHGVEVLSDTNVVGQTMGNIISASTQYGIYIQNANGTVIQDNLIGTDITGTNSLGNGKDGVYMELAVGTLVGGTNTLLGNTIAFNNGAGVNVHNNNATNNAILGNSIFLNSGLGIDLKGDGVTANHAGGKVSGPNNLQNFPLLSQATTSTNTTVQGILSSQSNTTYRLEFFSNPVCDPSGYGEGETLLGEAAVTIGANGSTNFNVAFPTLVSTGLYITATATDPFNNTSEFSPCVLVTAGGTPSADLSLSWKVSPDPVNVGSNFTYTFTVSNNGPSPATILSFSDSLPSGITVLSTSASLGVSTKIGNTVTWSLTTLASGSNVTVTINAGAPSTPGAPTNAATVAAAELDPAPADNTALAVVNVVDTQPPSITAPANVTVNTDTGQCFATSIALGSPATADNVAVALVVNDAPLQFPKGVNIVTWTATDTSGNTATATQIVTVVDNELPMIVGLSDLVVNTDVGKNFASGVALGSPITADNCGVATVTNHAPAHLALGTNTVTWTAIDTSGNNATVDQKVIVKDAEPPTITARATVTVHTDAGKSYATGVTLGVPITADNVGVASIVNNAPAQFPAGTNTVTWTVADTSGNTASATQKVVVRDVEKPTITAPVDITVGTDPGQCFATGTALGSPITADNVGVASVNNNAPATFPKGTTTLTWTVMDTSGNSATATQKVKVNDTEPPTITAPPDVTVNANPGKSYATGVALGSPTTADNCGVASVNNNAPTKIPVGTNTVTWTVADTSGNTATATQTVTVVGLSTGSADLTGSWVASKYGCFTNGAYSGRCYIVGYLEIDNIGSLRTTPCQINYYRSTNSVFDASATLILTKKMKRLAPGKSIRQLFGVRPLPGDNPTGEHLIAVIDSTAVVAESTKTNNVIVDAPLQ